LSIRGVFQIDLRVVAYDNAGNQNQSAFSFWKVQILQK